MTTLNEQAKELEEARIDDSLSGFQKWLLNEFEGARLQDLTFREAVEMLNDQSFAKFIQCDELKDKIENQIDASEIREAFQSDRVICVYIEIEKIFVNEAASFIEEELEEALYIRDGD